MFRLEQYFFNYFLSSISMDLAHWSGRVKFIPVIILGNPVVW